MKLSILFLATAAILVIANTAYVNAYPADRQNDDGSNDAGFNNNINKNQNHSKNNTPSPDKTPNNNSQEDSVDMDQVQSTMNNDSETDQSYFRMFRF
ncbi:hypothetical protein BDF19DRAFT_432476 [Syncephalis fuscata]|nr:hypothetical protein BDF19DRAFT_432476 [Syncephalis fuscata]